MTYNYTVFIGRFQPFHAGHYEVVKEALSKSDRLIMVLGSHNEPRTPRNPFTTYERKCIIESALTKEEFERIDFAPVQDHRYNLQKWIGEVQGAVFSIVHREWKAGPTSIALIGMNKDDTSYYLTLFPTWDTINVKNHDFLNATELREKVLYEAGENVMYEIQKHSHYFTCQDHKDMLLDEMGWASNEMRKEFKDLQEYKKTWGNGPFITVDACVIQSGFLLLVKRKEGQGKDLWALPGGFIDSKERLVDAVVRELREETKIKVPEPVLRGSLVSNQIYDDPYRSERARIVTNAFKFELREGPLPPVKGSDDAKEARWWPVSQVLQMRNVMFEDHYDIITDLLGL